MRSFSYNLGPVTVYCADGREVVFQVADFRMSFRAPLSKVDKFCSAWIAWRQETRAEASEKAHGRT